MTFVLFLQYAASEEDISLLENSTNCHKFYKFFLNTEFTMDSKVENSSKLTILFFADLLKFELLQKFQHSRRFIFVFLAILQVE